MAIHQLWNSRNVVEDANSTIVTPRFDNDKLVAFQVSLNQDPGPASNGVCAIEGRMDPTAAWVRVDEVDFTDLEGASVERSRVHVDVPRYPQMRAALRAEGAGPFLVSGGLTIDVWLQE